MKQDNFKDLPKISGYRYENFFNIYTDNDGFKFYNLLCSINLFPANNSSAEDTYVVKFNDTWASISYNQYNTMDLWWLVCAYNQIKNPVQKPQSGTVLKLLKSSFVSTVISSLQNQLSR